MVSTLLIILYFIASLSSIKRATCVLKFILEHEIATSTNTNFKSLVFITSSEMHTKDLSALFSSIQQYRIFLIPYFIRYTTVSFYEDQFYKEIKSKRQLLKKNMNKKNFLIVVSDMLLPLLPLLPYTSFVSISSSSIYSILSMPLMHHSMFLILINASLPSL